MSFKEYIKKLARIFFWSNWIALMFLLVTPIYYYIGVYIKHANSYWFMVASLIWIVLVILDMWLNTVMCENPWAVREEIRFKEK